MGLHVFPIPITPPTSLCFFLCELFCVEIVQVTEGPPLVHLLPECGLAALVENLL